MSHIRTLTVPVQVTSLALGHAGHLYVGSVDGILRLYDLSTFKVIQAVRGLGTEVSSVVCTTSTDSRFMDAWIAHGQRVSLFTFGGPKVIMTQGEALKSLELCASDDALNLLAISANRKFLGYTTDQGIVGVVDLSDNTVSQLKARHDNICGSITFIPGRPRELISAGYDSTFLHFDFMLGTTISRKNIAAIQPDGGSSMSPQFILCMAVSSSGALAAGLADGRLFVACGGEKGQSGSAGAKQPRAKKWKGLGGFLEILQHMANGPIVAIQFSDADTVIFSTLLGDIRKLRLLRDQSRSQNIQIEEISKTQTANLEKVNTLVVDGSKAVIGGIAKDGKGAIEYWEL